MKAVFETRRGFANYYFNKVERARTWNRAVARGDFHEQLGEWTLTGELAGGGEAQFGLSDALVACTMPGGHLAVPVANDLANITDPPGSGGMLAALHLWRRLLVLGPDRFGDVQYLGTVPLVTSQDLVDRRAIMLLGRMREAAASDVPALCDCLVGTYGGVECRFIFDPKSGNLAALEMFRAPDDDACELYFSDYGEIEGRVFPRQIECRYGDETYANIKLLTVKLDKLGDR